MLSSVVATEGIRGNGHKLKYRNFYLNVRKKLLVSIFLLLEVL